MQLAAANSNSSSEDAANSITSTISEFSHEPESDSLFQAWSKRWEETFINEFTCKDDTWKTDACLSENLEQANTNVSQMLSFRNRRI